MRTVLFLISVFAVFATSCYLTMERWDLPRPLANAIVTLTTVGAVALWIVYSIGNLRTTEQDRRWAAQVQAHRHREQERERIAAEMKKRMKDEIRKNPSLAPFLRDVESGAIASMEDLAYRSDPSMLVTCSHLRPIESKLRQAGCTMWLWHAWNYTPIPGTIFASALLQKFPAPLKYSEEEFYDERTPPYYSASLECPQCNSTIHCTHPNNTGPGTIHWKNL